MLKENLRAKISNLKHRNLDTVENNNQSIELTVDDKEGGNVILEVAGDEKTIWKLTAATKGQEN